jgi:hypothetical protein
MYCPVTKKERQTKLDMQNNQHTTKYSILTTHIVFFNCTSTKTRNNNYANEIRAFEEQSWLSGKESYVNGEYVHPYEAAFLTNDIGMLDYFYEQAIIEGNARYARQLNQPYHLSKKD